MKTLAVAFLFLGMILPAQAYDACDARYRSCASARMRGQDTVEVIARECNRALRYCKISGYWPYPGGGRQFIMEIPGRKARH